MRTLYLPSPAADMGAARSETACGLDSLSVVELRDQITRTLHANLAAAGAAGKRPPVCFAALVLRKSRVDRVGC